MTLYQNCSNRSAPLNKMTVRAKNKKKNFKRLLLLNECIDFEIILQEGSLGDPQPKLLKLSVPLNKMAARAKNRKTFKRLLLLNQKMDCEIIIQECFLGDPLPKLLKRFGYVEQDGRQGYK